MLGATSSLARRWITLFVSVGAILGVGVKAWASNALALTLLSAGTEATQLAHSLEQFALELGRPAGRGIEATIAALPAPVAGSLAELVGALLECDLVTSQAVDGLSTSGLSLFLEGGYSYGWQLSAELFRCAHKVDAKSAAVRDVLMSMTGAELELLPRIDAWPILRFEPRNSDDQYWNDYVLLIDRVGNDLYGNNAGGNLLDLVRGPVGSNAPEIGPAAGCQNIPSLIRGGCVMSTALLMDFGGNDRYGVFEAADEDSHFVSIDGTVRECTRDRLVRRIVTEGAGVAGVGMLIDGGGNDVYLGKTLTQGAGHASGIGILRDHGAGNDRYLAIRSAQGFGLVGDAYGLLWDEGGNDIYDFYMPAGDNTLPGGVVSDRNVCDATPRNIQGVGLLSGTGLLQDGAGNDSYRASESSQGYGSLGGQGTFWDCGGSDRYVGEADRWNGQVVMPTADSTGMFIDEGKSRGSK